MGNWTWLASLVFVVGCSTSSRFAGDSDATVAENDVDDLDAGGIDSLPDAAGGDGDGRLGASCGSASDCGSGLVCDQEIEKFFSVRPGDFYFGEGGNVHNDDSGG